MDELRSQYELRTPKAYQGTCDWPKCQERSTIGNDYGKWCSKHFETGSQLEELLQQQESQPHPETTSQGCKWQWYETGSGWHWCQLKPGHKGLHSRNDGTIPKDNPPTK